MKKAIIEEVTSLPVNQRAELIDNITFPLRSFRHFDRLSDRSLNTSRELVLTLAERR